MRADDAIPEARHRIRIVAGSDQRVETRLIREELAFLSIAFLETFGLAIEILNHLVVLVEDVATIADRRYAEQFLERARGVNCSLMRNQVAQLVRDDARQFVFALRSGNEFARNVNPSTGNYKRIRVRQFNQKELKPQLVQR